MKRTASVVIVLAVVILSLSVCALASEDVTNSGTETLVATPSSEKIFVDGIQKNFTVYNIDGSNYIKLRDLGKALSSTDAKFDVRYDATTNSVYLTSGFYYTSIGGELSGNSDVAMQNITCSFVKLNGSMSVPAYNINGNNYFNLRYIARILNFYVRYNQDSDIVNIGTAQSYEAEKTDSTPLLAQWNLYSAFFDGSLQYATGTDTLLTISIYDGGLMEFNSNSGYFTESYELDGSTMIYHTSDGITRFVPYEISTDGENTYLTLYFASEYYTYMKQS